MKPSEQCKEAGLKSLVQLSQITGESQQTLINWHKNKPRLFAVVVAGARIAQVQMKYVIDCMENEVFNGTSERIPTGLIKP